MISRFESSRFDRKPVYTCRICKKQTRDTGHDERSLELCAFCMQEAELENALNDGGIDESQFDAALVKLQQQYKRGAFAKTTKKSAPMTDVENAADEAGLSQANEDAASAEAAERKPVAKKRTAKKSTSVADLIPEFANDNAPKLPEPTRSTKRTSTKSRAPEAKRARKIIRNYLRASIYLAFALELGDEAETEAATETYELAHAALSTLAGYEDTDIIR